MINRSPETYDEIIKIEENDPMDQIDPFLIEKYHSKIEKIPTIQKGNKVLKNQTMRVENNEERDPRKSSFQRKEETLISDNQKIVEKSKVS